MINFFTSVKAIWSTISIDEGFAALIAATAAFVSAGMSIRSAKIVSQLSVKQNFLATDLKILSATLYEIVALSVEAGKSRSSQRFKVKIAEATSKAVLLDEIRRQHRYSLPFIFDAIWYLKGLPLYISHYQNDLENPRVQLLIAQATKLRESIDECLENYFYHGRRPNIWMRSCLSRNARKLEEIFREGVPDSTKAEV